MPKTVEEVKAEREARKRSLSDAVASTKTTEDKAPEPEPIQEADTSEPTEAEPVAPKAAEEIDKAAAKEKPAKKEKAPKADKPSEKDAGKSIGGLAIESVSERTDYMNALIFGDPGVGKTRLAGSSAEIEAMSPVLFIDIEGGTKSIRDLYPTVDVVRIKDKVNSHGRVVQTAWEQLQSIYEDVRKGVLPYKTYVIDSLTEAHKLCMEHVLVKETLKAEERGRDKDTDVAEQRDWGIASSLFRRMIRAFRDLDAHTIFTAHVAETKDQQTGSVQFLPSLPGKLAREVPGYLDEVFFLYVKEEKGDIQRKLLSQPTGKYFAKDRSDKMPTVLVDPVMQEISAYVLDQQS